MGVRLNKVVKELGVGLQTLVDYLEKKGVTVDANPNTKIEDDAYELLVDRFSTDKNLRNTVLQRQTEKEQEKVKRDKEKAAAKEKKAQEVIKTEVPDEIKPQFKTVGKIDLEAKPKPAAKTGKPQPAATKAKTKEQPKKETPKTAPAQPKEPAKAEDQPKQEMPAAAKAASAPAKPQPETPQAEVKTAEPVKAKETPAETPKAEAPAPQTETADKKETKPAEEVFRLGTTPTISGPKVLGTIDLSSINENMRPRKKTKEEKRKEREEKARQAAPAGGQPGSGQRKKKRNRVQGSKVDITTEAKKVTDDGRQENKQGFGNQNNQRNQNQQRGNKKQKKGDIALKPQVSDEDVANEVKKTLARLTSKKSFANSAKYRREKRDQVRAATEERLNEESRESKILKLTEFVTANELASMMNVPVTKVIATCMSIGMMISINQRMDAETINLVADEFGFQTEYVSASVSEAVHEEEDNEEDLEPRDPIVTIMGHVDHGKTSLLDYIRNSNVIAGEAGGITQHIGAYNVKLENGRHITFLDTPGHEAFTAMRARGAQVTDIAIIIIAADDDVMPQTKEAINHAMAANVPIVFAINKVDKPTANPEKIKETLANMNFLVEDWGGKYQSQDISAKKGIGVNELLEKVLLEADMLELKANPNRRATGTVIESSLDKGRGYVATVLVSNGTLHVGDNVIAGTCFGRVRDLNDERGKRIKSVGPAKAATLLGFNGAPQAGDTFHVMETEQEVRDIANKRLQLQREQSLRTSHRTTLEEIGNRIAQGGFQELNIIVKGDVDGSVEALSDALIKLSTEKIAVSVIHKAVGQITESDVSLAAASQAIIIGFQVRPSAQARKEAEQEGIDIRLYSIIYDAIHDVKTAMEGMLKPIIKEEATATLEVRQVYRISKVGTVAGAFVVSGKVSRTDKARLIHDGIVKFTGEINALKRFKDDVKEVNQDFECGISLLNYNDIQEGDTIETFREIEVKQKL